MDGGLTADRDRDKAALREELLLARAALAPRAGSAEALEAGTAAARLLLEVAELQGARSVALYLAFGHEFDPAPIGEMLAGRGGALCYPRVAPGPGPGDAGRLCFHVLQGAEPDPGALRRHPFGVLEPGAEQPLAQEIDTFVIPGLGFDRAGRRLGYGKGYYDRALRAWPAALRIAACYPFQLRPAIPHDEHDEPVDLIVTPQEVHRTGARSPTTRRIKQ